MSEVSEFFNEATQEIVKVSMRETLRQAMKLTQDVYRKASEVEPPMRPALVNVERPEPPDTLEVLTENLAQLTIARDILSDLITATVTIQKDRISKEASESVLNAMRGRAE